MNLNLASFVHVNLIWAILQSDAGKVAYQTNMHRSNDQLYFNLIGKMKLIHNKFEQSWGSIDARRKLEYWDCFFHSITQSYQYLSEFMEFVDCGDSNPNDTSRALRKK